MARRVERYMLATDTLRTALELALATCAEHADKASSPHCSVRRTFVVHRGNSCFGHGQYTNTTRVGQECFHILCGLVRPLSAIRA